jgi:hypothetical protein
MAALEIGWDNGSILLLTCRIPNIEFSGFALQSDVLDLEINCGDFSAFFGFKLSLNESPEEGSFSYITIAHQNELVLFLLPKWEVPFLHHVIIFRKESSFNNVSEYV